LLSPPPLESGSEFPPQAVSAVTDRASAATAATAFGAENARVIREVVMVSFHRFGHRRSPNSDGCRPITGDTAEPGLGLLGMVVDVAVPIRLVRLPSRSHLCPAVGIGKPHGQ
jgi:hypothetical protein